MPHAQMAAMVPLTLRALKQRELLTQARRNTALKSEHEARLNLLLKRSSWRWRISATRIFYRFQTAGPLAGRQHR